MAETIQVFDVAHQQRQRELHSERYCPRVAIIPTAWGEYTLFRGLESDRVRLHPAAAGFVAGTACGVYLLGGDRAAMSVLSGTPVAVFQADEVFAAADDAAAVLYAYGLIRDAVGRGFAELNAAAASLIDGAR